MDIRSERRLAENEVVYKMINTDIKDFVLEDAKNTIYAKRLLGFFCECSNVDCHERIRMTAKEYDKIHANKKSFIVLPGHDMPEIEDIVTKKPEYLVVEKKIVPPLPKDINPKDFL